MTLIEAMQADGVAPSEELTKQIERHTALGRTVAVETAGKDRVVFVEWTMDGERHGSPGLVMNDFREPFAALKMTDLLAMVQS